MTFTQTTFVNKSKGYWNLFGLNDICVPTFANKSKGYWNCNRLLVQYYLRATVFITVLYIHNKIINVRKCRSAVNQH